MKYFKKGAEVFAFEADGSQDDYITSDMVEMTAAEVKKHTTPQPTPSHVWDDVLEQWVDSRTPEQIEADRLAAFPPLTRRQFKLALLENNLLSQIDQVIAAIEDPATKARYEIEILDFAKLLIIGTIEQIDSIDDLIKNHLQQMKFILKQARNMMM